jgi:carboxypeptidase Taq
MCYYFADAGGVTSSTCIALLLQDVHWSAGLFGYFPTYSLGAMYACQIYEHAKQQLPDLEQQVAAGNFKPLRVRPSAAAAPAARHVSAVCLAAGW